jgi:hypothetical protein
MASGKRIVLAYFTIERKDKTMTLILHRGAEQASRMEIGQIPIPEATRSYAPITHGELSDILAQKAEILLPEFTHHKSQFGLARQGQQLFGIHSYRNGSTDLALSIGFRNSYDKSLSVGVAVGASVLVCDNLALSGDVTLMRKHTTNVEVDLDSLIVSAILKARTAFHQVKADAHSMQQLPLRDDDAYRLIGLMYGKGVISPRQIPVVHSEWLKPSHVEFQARTLWSFYNAITEALKSTPPRIVMERHLLASRVISNVQSRMNGVPS